MNANIRQMVSFRVERFLFGIEVHKVQEVLRHQEVTRVPLAPDVVQGLINLRGQIIPAIDMRRRLGLGEGSGSDHVMNVVVRAEGETVSLLVDDIGDVIEVSEAQFEDIPPTLRAGLGEVLRGVYKLQSQLLLELRPECAVAVESDRDE